MQLTQQNNNQGILGFLQADSLFKKEKGTTVLKSSERKSRYRDPQLIERNSMTERKPTDEMSNGWLREAEKKVVTSYDVPHIQKLYPLANRKEAQPIKSMVSHQRSLMEDAIVSSRKSLLSLFNQNQHINQGLVTQRKNYFRQCKFQSIEYLNKMEGLLLSDLQMVKWAENKALKESQAIAQRLGSQIQESLREAIQLCILRWKELQIYHQQQHLLNQFPQIMELKLQIQERLRHIKSLTESLENSEWKQTAVQILTVNHETHIGTLSELCRQNISKLEKGPITTHLMEVITQKEVESLKKTVQEIVSQWLRDSTKKQLKNGNGSKTMGRQLPRTSSYKSEIKALEMQ